MGPALAVIGGALGQPPRAIYQLVISEHLDWVGRVQFRTPFRNNCCWPLLEVPRNRRFGTVLYSIPRRLLYSTVQWPPMLVQYWYSTVLYTTSFSSSVLTTVSGPEEQSVIPVQHFYRRPNTELALPWQSRASASSYSEASSLKLLKLQSRTSKL